jgi:hypothetical protein
MVESVSFELAKLLKEKGFDEPCPELYYSPEKCKKPTIAQVVMWLYKKHKIWVCTDKSEGFNWWKFNIRRLKDVGFEYGGFGSDFNSPQEAYQAAFKHILEELI